MKAVLRVTVALFALVLVACEEMIPDDSTEKPSGPNSCIYANDGECDEGMTRGYCPVGTDTADCAQEPEPEPVVDTQPSFGRQTVADQTYTEGTAIVPLVLPAATGGDGSLAYSLTPNVPGLGFTATTRTLQGTPTTAGTHSMTYRVVDSDGDATRLLFTIQVDVVDTQPSFGGQTVADQTYTRRNRITPLPLPIATGGDGSLRYSLSHDVPGLDFLAVTRVMRGTPTELGVFRAEYRVEDADGDFDVLGFVITVQERENTAAPECLETVREDNSSKFRNVCSELITVFYCYVTHNPGFGSSLCGENGQAWQPYYTSYEDLSAGATETYGSSEARNYAVCRGDINPYIEDDFVSDHQGNYGCYPRPGS